MTPGRRATHPCPGDCGARVPNHLFACAHDWYRLPLDLRRAIYATAHLSLFDDERAAVVSDAMDWYANDN